MLSLCAIAGAGDYLFSFDLLRAIGPVRASVVNYTPVVAVVLGWLLFDERRGLAAVVGLLLVAVGSRRCSARAWSPSKARMAEEEVSRIGIHVTDELEAWEWEGGGVGCKNGGPK